MSTQPARQIGLGFPSEQKVKQGIRSTHLVEIAMFAMTHELLRGDADDFWVLAKLTEAQVLDAYLRGQNF